MPTAVQLLALRGEEQRVSEKNLTREYANYLVTMRRLHEDADDVPH